MGIPVPATAARRWFGCKGSLLPAWRKERAMAYSLLPYVFQPPEQPINSFFIAYLKTLRGWTCPFFLFKAKRRLAPLL